MAKSAWAQQRVGQLVLLQQYRALAESGAPLPALIETEFSAHSQNGEDGILLFVFALAGFQTRLTVEIAAGDGVECNSANLILHHGFTGLLVDASEERCGAGRAFYASHPATQVVQPRIVSAWVNRDNVDALISAHVQRGEVDLLSIDLDGNDYWVLERIECIQPRIIVVEFVSMWRDHRACTIPYDPEFRWEPAPLSYCGASLPAFVKLLRPRGYRLVGADRLCINAVFVRNDLAPRLLPEVSVGECFPESPLVRQAEPVEQQIVESIAKRSWVDV